MKKLLFVLGFALIGQQTFSQMYIVTIADYTIGGCVGGEGERTITTVTPTGTETHICIPTDIANGALI